MPLRRISFFTPPVSGIPSLFLQATPVGPSRPSSMPSAYGEYYSVRTRNFSNTKPFWLLASPLSWAMRFPPHRPIEPCKSFRRNFYSEITFSA